MAEGGALWGSEEDCAHTGKPSAEANATTATWRGREPDINFLIVIGFYPLANATPVFLLGGRSVYAFPKCKPYAKLGS